MLSSAMRTLLVNSKLQYYYDTNNDIVLGDISITKKIKKIDKEIRENNLGVGNSQYPYKKTNQLFKLYYFDEELLKLKEIFTSTEFTDYIITRINNKSIILYRENSAILFEEGVLKKEFNCGNELLFCYSVSPNEGTFNFLFKNIVFYANKAKNYHKPFCFLLKSDLALSNISSSFINEEFIETGIAIVRGNQLNFLKNNNIFFLENKFDICISNEKIHLVKHDSELFGLKNNSEEDIKNNIRNHNETLVKEHNKSLIRLLI